MPIDFDKESDGGVEGMVDSNGLPKVKQAIKTALPLDKHAIFATGAFALFYIEHFNVFNNENLIEFILGDLNIPFMNINLVSSLATCLGFLTLIIFYSRKRFQINSLKGLAVCCCMIIVSPLLWSVLRSFSELGAFSLMGLALFSFGHLCFLPSMVKNFAIAGPVRSLGMYALALVASSFCRPFLAQAPSMLLVAVIMATPVLMWILLRAANKHAPIKLAYKFDKKSYIPKTLVVTLIVCGALSGLSAGLGARGMGSIGVSLFIQAICVAFMVIFLVAPSRMHYNRLIFFIAMPLMIYGVALLTVGGELGLTFGFLVYHFGYDFLYAALWSLYGYLLRYSTFNYYWLPILAAFSTFLGRAGCLLGINGLLLLPLGSRVLPIVSVSLSFVAILIAIAFYGRNNMKNGWGSFALQDNPFALDDFEKACSSLATAAGLTPQERNAFLLLAKGNGGQAIADKLVISKGTAKTHIKHVYAKIGVHSQQEVIDLVERNKKIEVDGSSR